MSYRNNFFPPKKISSIDALYYFGMAYGYSNKVGYGKWFFSIYPYLKESVNVLKFINYNGNLFNYYTGQSDLLSNLYLYHLLKKNICTNLDPRKSILHVLYQTPWFHKIFNVADHFIQNRRFLKVLTVHDVYDNAGNIVVSLQNTINQTDSIFVPSLFTKKTLQQNFDYDREIYVTYNPVDTSFFHLFDKKQKALCRQLFLSKYSIAPCAKLLLYVGSEMLRKNIEGIFIQLSKLMRAQPNVYLIVVSHPSPRRSYLIKLAKNMGIYHHILWLNYISDVELLQLYNSVDIFITLSTCEGFCMPVLEAMASGTPVIASNLTAIPEIVGDGGILVDVYNHEYICARIIEIFNSQSITQSLIKKGLSRSKFFESEQIANYYTSSYDAILRKNMNC